MADDEVTAELKRIREQREWTAMPRLVAALEAVLKLAGEWKQFAVSGDAQDECADKLREAITRELTGKEASNG